MIIGSETLDATHYELAGIYTILRIFQCLVQYYGIDDASIEIDSNYEGCLKRTLLNTDETPLYYVNDSHADPINAVNHIQRTCKVQIKGRHIYANQDDYFIYENLDWWSQWNVDMELLAKSLMFQKRHHKMKNSAMSISNDEGFAVIINNTKVTGSYINTIRDNIQGQKLLGYWNKQGYFPSDQNMIEMWLNTLKKHSLLTKKSG